MKIGLVRHFKVLHDQPQNKMVSQEDIMAWFAEYDQAEVKKGEVHLGDVKWECCYSSDLPRAVTTAEALFDGRIIQEPAIREIKMYPLFKRNVKLPFWGWAILLRIAWLLHHHSQLERKPLIIQRINVFLDELENSLHEQILIVGHGAMMIYMQKELSMRGYRGPAIRNPKNGRLYLYEK
ncbi:histidine phosphatase family protein [Falsibacillus albus]|uniref:Histidine phosphatase family protein n=1 Tax=Falsibacillus albus TaxID=2478915 RepID=A0A3L7JUB3_9BACI|nr:histidine phosphatase family protein [Falsibacillus albus]RLQ94326.1 histidine phosphatase family protein [Falsibacillus albus]